MTKTPNNRNYDLEERTFQFAKRVIWIRLIVETNNLADDSEGKSLIQESSGFIKIFNSILGKGR